MGIVLITGGFDPLHSGHISYIKEAKLLGKYLIVGINSDEWLTRKKGRPFMSWAERAQIVENIKGVDKVISFDDSDNTANFAIYKVLQMFPNKKIIFANGGDRTVDNIPELIYKNTPWVDFKFGVGGNAKQNSSSWILNDWKTQKTDRGWGHWRVLDDKGCIKVKELIINPGCSLSDQRHRYRSEHWYILKGSVKINDTIFQEHTTCVIDKMEWHKATNVGDGPAHVLEVQYGTRCVEEDIERRD